VSLAAFYMHDMGGGWWPLMMLGWGVFWVAVIWLIVTQVRSGPAHEPSPREILDRRLARGEISPDEYERLRDTLQQQPSKPTPTHA
jgi:putative membrane protein